MSEPSAASPSAITRPTWNGRRRGRARGDSISAGSNILACSLDDLPERATRVALERRERQRLCAADRRHRRALRRRPRIARDDGRRDTAGANFLVSRRCSSRATTCWSSGPATIRCSARRGCSARGRCASIAASRSGFALDPDRVRRAMTPRTKLDRDHARRTIRPACAADARGARRDRPDRRARRRARHRRRGLQGRHRRRQRRRRRAAATCSSRRAA